MTKHVWFFQDFKSPVHEARMITHWFERKYDSAVNHMLTPFKHLDPVKHVWKILDWHIKTVLTIKHREYL